MRFLTQSEVAALLRRSPQTIARWRRRGILPFLPGKPVLIEETQLQTIIKQWLEPTKAHGSKKMNSESTRSDGRQTDAQSAFQRGRKAYRERSASWPDGYLKKAEKTGRR